MPPAPASHLSTSKPKFRSRKLDYKRPLPIHHAQDLPDLDQAEISRAVPQVATGVEKEEEEEHHLQAVISAAAAQVQQQRDRESSLAATRQDGGGSADAGEAQTKQNAAPSVYIPIPDATQLIDYYAELYSRPFPLPTNLIRFSQTVEDCTGPFYCMDAKDFEWLRAYNQSLTSKQFPSKRSPSPSKSAQASPPKGKASAATTTSTPISPLTEIQFEMVISELEKISFEKQRQTPPQTVTLSDLEPFLLLQSSTPRLKQAAPAVFEYWKKQKEALGQKPLMPILKLEEYEPKTTGQQTVDPWVCFRKREIKTTRKTRRTDAQSIQKLRQMRSEMETAKVLLEMVVKREKLRMEVLVTEQTLWEQRVLSRVLQNHLGLPADVIEEAKAQRKRALKLRGIGSPSPNRTARTAIRKRKVSSVEDVDHMKDPITIAIENDLHRYRMANLDWEDLTGSLSLRLPNHPAYAYIQDQLVVPAKETECQRGRYRYGRGGRLWIDRRPRIPLQQLSSAVIRHREDPWKFDDFEDESDQEFVDIHSMPALFAYRLKLLDENDYSQLLCKHTPTPPPPAPKAPTPALAPPSASSASSSGSASSSRPHKGPGRPAGSPNRKASTAGALTSLKQQLLTQRAEEAKIKAGGASPTKDSKASPSTAVGGTTKISTS